MFCLANIDSKPQLISLFQFAVPLQPVFPKSTIFKGKNHLSSNRATQNKSRARLGTLSTVPATSLSRLILRKAALKVPSIAETRLALRPHHLLNFPSLLLPVLPGHWVPPPALVPTTAAPKTPGRCREGGRHRRPPPSPRCRHAGRICCPAL